MDDSIENASPPAARGARPTTFVIGAGQVPSGPRNSFQPSMTPLRGAFIPENNHVHIKQEETERNWSTDSEEEGKISGDGNIKREMPPETELSRYLDTDYQTLFSRLLASSARSSRSDTTGSRRQDTSEGRWSRSERLASFRPSDRSRSPLSRRSSMFYSESRALTDVHPATHIPSHSRSRRASTDPSAESSRRGSLSQRRLLSHDPSSLPLSTASSSSSRPISLAPSTHLASSSTETSPAPEENEEQDDRCRCPIGIFCPKRHTDHLDCRPLVRERKTWRERRDEETFERHREAGSHGERFTTDQDLERVINYFHEFLSAATPAPRGRAVANILAWIIDMEDVTLTAGYQQTSAIQNVIPAMTAFLAPENSTARRAGNLPSYFEEELTFLQRKWSRGDFSGNIWRGLVGVELEDMNGTTYLSRARVEQNWPFHVSALYFGQGTLVNGQVWESRAELQRDGVHAPSIGGISGTKKDGARSIVLGAFDEKNNIGYADIDMGDIIEYMGTALPDQDGLGPTNVKDPHMGIPKAWDHNSPGEPTVATQAMFKSLETGTPVRVIRSFAMCKIVKNKPIRGYRFDGMYRVIGATAMKEARQIWSFRLQRLPERLPNHGPLRGFSSKADQPDSTGRRMGHFHKQAQNGRLR